MKLRITTLSENTTGNFDYLAEWGLSFLVEAGKESILFDTGRSTSASYNINSLAINPGHIGKIALSRGHSDHTGGLRQLLRQMKKEVEIIAHPDIWAGKYSRRKGKKDRYNGIPFQRQELESLGAIFNLTTKPVKIADDIMTTGEVPMVTDYEEIDSALFIKKDGAWQPDKLLDDLSLIITTPPGLVVVLGCAHRGMINHLYHAQQLTGVKKIYAVLGGAHLYSASKERVQQTITALKELEVQKLGLCHCTGLPAISHLAQEFGDKFLFNTAGTIIDLS